MQASKRRRVMAGTLLAWAATVLALPAGESAPGQAILTEAGVWRTFVVWKPIQTWDGNVVNEGRLRGGLTSASPAPPDNWAAPEFDDAGWGFWRETYAPPEFLKIEEEQNAQERQYEHRQYGMLLSPELGARYLRGRFVVRDPAAVGSLTLTLAYRGGVIVYLNGREEGRAHVEPGADHAEPYPDGTVTTGKAWRATAYDDIPPFAPDRLRWMNLRIRQFELRLDPETLRQGVNVLAIRVLRAPSGVGKDQSVGLCAPVEIALRGSGAVETAVDRPRGVQVWSANALTKVSPHGSVLTGRVGPGGGGVFYNFPLSWSEHGAPVSPLRIVGTRNGVFSGQVAVTSDGPIRDLRAEASDLKRRNGPEQLPASIFRIFYEGMPEQPPSDLGEPAVSLLDALYARPPAVIEPMAGKPRDMFYSKRNSRPVAWADAGAICPVWLWAHVPADAVPGEYEGSLTVRTADSQPTQIPIRLSVRGFALPAPRDFVAHMGIPQSPDTLALKYRVAMWSDAHFKLIEESFSLIGQASGNAVFMHLAHGVWPGSQETMVRWVKNSDGTFHHDFEVFDRYLDIAQKYLRLEAVILNVLPAGFERRGITVSQLDPATGKTAPMEALPAKDGGVSPEALAFWKPVMDGIRTRLTARGLADRWLMGTTPEAARRGQEAARTFVSLFKELCPGVKWTDFAHYAARRGEVAGVPYGYAMSVWGNSTPFKSKAGYGAPDLPLILVQFYRATPGLDVRPTSHRGAFYMAVDRAMGGLNGVGPLGADYWNLTPEEKGETGRRVRFGPMETPITNLNMYNQGTAALLAPGPNGPIPTVRFQLVREGLQFSQARWTVERIMRQSALRDRLPETLKSRYEQFRANPTQAFVRAGEERLQGEGWTWFETSGWEDQAEALFDLADAMVQAVGMPSREGKQ